jgi:hypothetical protein
MTSATFVLHLKVHTSAISLSVSISDCNVESLQDKEKRDVSLVIFQLYFIVTRLHPGLLSLRPAGSLSSLSEPLSKNLVFQVTLYTSFKLHG